MASFLLGWGVTVGAGLASYPLDTIRRRMMMTSGSGVNYKSMFDAGSQIVAKEGTKSLFKGAGANILRGVAGAGVLSLYDKLQEIMFGKVYSGGQSLPLLPLNCADVSFLQALVKYLLGILLSLHSRHLRFSSAIRRTTIFLSTHRATGYRLFYYTLPRPITKCEREKKWTTRVTQGTKLPSCPALP